MCEKTFDENAGGLERKLCMATDGMKKGCEMAAGGCDNDRPMAQTGELVSVCFWEVGHFEHEPDKIVVAISGLDRRMVEAYKLCLQQHAGKLHDIMRASGCAWASWRRGGQAGCA